MLPQFHFSRRCFRLSAFVALLALLLQLVAGNISTAHAAERLAKPSDAFEICTPAGIISIAADGQSELPASQAGAQQCPFCASAAGSPPLLAVALSFFLPASTAAEVLPATPAGILPAAPDQRHAPSRAPPSLFA